MRPNAFWPSVVIGTVAWLVIGFGVCKAIR